MRRIRFSPFSIFISWKTVGKAGGVVVEGGGMIYHI
jgi:hypothetical protein